MSPGSSRRDQAPKALLNVDQTAILPGESRDSLYDSIKRGDLRLPVYRINGRIGIPRPPARRVLDGRPLVVTDEDRQ